MISAKENSLEVLLEDFANKKMKARTNVQTKVKTDISLKERAKLGMEMLSKQRPFTLSEKRAQAISVMMSSVSRNKQADEAVKYNLRRYFPQLSEEQIEEGLIKLYSIYNESVI